MKRNIKYTEITSFKQETDQVKEMERACRKMRITVSEFIRFSITRSLDDIKKTL